MGAYHPGSMELRRALLLFAIVLGLAALVSSVVEPGRRASPRTAATGEPPAGAPRGGRSGAPRPLHLSASGTRPRTVTVRAGVAAVLSVAVEEPGQVSIPDLGQTAAAEPATPARFDLLVERPGRLRVVFAPAAGGPAARVGTMRVTR